ncbi:LCP family protein [Patescibacteria group bacterium]|nr:LCP family protein [Patescibacteria group bacterium]
MQTKIKRMLLPKTLRIIAVLVLLLFLAVFSGIIVKTQRFMQATSMTPGAVIRLLFDTGAKLQSENGRTNVLLLGVPGGNHAGADLTDTIIVLSLDVPRKTAAMISIPRDIWSETLKDKVNSAYHYGEEKKKGGGFILAKAVVEDALGIPVHYGVLIDFSGFQSMIDEIGGVTINVPQAFTDTEFPIAGKEDDTCNNDPTFACRYESVHFDEGTQEMDGKRALIYVRSRHAKGEEGTDFARGRRQQEVLLALKEKIFSPNILFSFRRIKILVRLFDEAVDTDMTIVEALTFIKLASRTPRDHMRSSSIESMLQSPPISWYGRYVLVPKENWEAIHSFVKEALRKD